MEQMENIDKRNDRPSGGQDLPPGEPDKDFQEQDENAQPPRKLKMKTLQEFDGGKNQPAGSNIDFILDIPVQLTVELGKTRMTIQDLLQLAQGSVIGLGKIAGEPVDVMVHRKLVARGEVIRVNEKLGVRLTDIAAPQERMEKSL